MPLRNAAYSSQPASGWLACTARSASVSWLRAADSNALRRDASGIAMRMAGGRSWAHVLPLVSDVPHSSAASKDEVSLCIARL